MSKNTKSVSIAAALLLVIGFTYFVFTAPYARFPGVRIGGELTSAPADWTSLSGKGVVHLKLAGFPPFVAKVFYATDEGGLITATRPDNGYWAKRVRQNPNGWIRIGDATYELKAEEIFGDARTPYLESYGGDNKMNMGLDFDDEVIVGQNEPLHTWEVFYWQPR